MRRITCYIYALVHYIFSAVGVQIAINLLLQISITTLTFLIILRLNLLYCICRVDLFWNLYIISLLLRETHPHPNRAQSFRISHNPTLRLACRRGGRVTAVPPCPACPPAPSWPPTAAPCCSATGSWDPGCTPSPSSRSAQQRAHTYTTRHNTITTPDENHPVVNRSIP